MNLDYQPGLGYSPAAAGPYGGYEMITGPGFFGQQPISTLLPSGVPPGQFIRFGFGKSVRKSGKSGRASRASRASRKSGRVGRKSGRASRKSGRGGRISKKSRRGKKKVRA